MVYREKLTRICASQIRWNLTFRSYLLGVVWLRRNVSCRTGRPPLKVVYRLLSQLQLYTAWWLLGKRKEKKDCVYFYLYLISIFVQAILPSYHVSFLGTRPWPWSERSLPMETLCLAIQNESLTALLGKRDRWSVTLYSLQCYTSENHVLWLSILYCHVYFCLRWLYQKANNLKTRNRRISLCSDWFVTQWLANRTNCIKGDWVFKNVEKKRL